MMSVKNITDPTKTSSYTATSMGKGKKLWLSEWRKPCGALYTSLSVTTKM